ncbi:hypoxanthine phosphoribosyltransferase [Lachnoanaerobaculum saburreum F0468]|jgi:hypoxanthine phosphoribosyltransferase|uniref:Hypoxanthine phosphoribosyltransferase n=1 Tax=Lachnoanaerobaculum saburreum F0468 TaxID=1095750 RepID=I0R658_9FIRM|nr:hypoxanthine phosphoribosyltransferase [Lachnoanaerobaculum saburreum]EIC95166.1 hypoxanthine phosphoribosyltransferase [Lachnoanaerobaculum saburreum F0468]
MKEKVDILISENEIHNRILEIADRINKDYEGEELTLICVLKGGVMFMCDLARKLNLSVRLDFMSVSSYGSETKSSGVVKIIKDLDDSIDGKNVLVVEDIIDSGNTLSYLIDILKKRGPKSIKLCTLLDKPSRREKKDVFVDYVCFEIEDRFVVGYGLDYDQRYRNLPYIGVMELSD